MSMRGDSQKGSSLYWDAGWSAWLTFVRDNKSPKKSPEESPVLLRWMENQREQYRLFQEGKPSELDQEMIKRMNAKKFPWVIPEPGDEKEFEKDDDPVLDSSSNAHDATVQSDEESKETPQRRSSRKRRSTQSMNMSSPSPKKSMTRRSRRVSNETQENETEDTEATPQRYPRRRRKSVSESGMVDSGTIGSQTVQHEKNMPGSPNKAAFRYDVIKKDSRGEESIRSYECRNLRRLVPEEEEEKVRKQCRKEFKDLLVCEEALEPDQENGIDPQMARINREWEESFFEFLVFKKVYGHSFVPKLFPENLSLGRWTSKVRGWKKKNDRKLTKSRLRRLKTAGFVWDAKKDPAFWSIQQHTLQEENKWETNFLMLVEFKQEHGHVLVPKEYAENMILSRWVSLQRKEKKLRDNGEMSHLTDDRVKRLEDLGFAWNTRSKEHLRQAVFSRFQDRWDRSIESLKEFKARFGHCAVPRRWPEDEDLAAWAMRQRAQGRKYRQGRDSYLTEERYQELVNLDFVFDIERGKYSLTEISQPDDDEGNHIDDENDDGAKNPDSDEEGRLDDDLIHHDEGDDLQLSVTKSVENDDARPSSTKSNDHDTYEPVETDHALPVESKSAKTDAEDNTSEVDLRKDEELEKQEALLSDEEKQKQEALLRQEEEQKKQELLLRATNKGRWICETTGKDDHLSYVNFLAHEATSLGLTDLFIDQSDALD